MKEVGAMSSMRVPESCALRIVLGFLVVALCGGCATKIYRGPFDATAPKTIGVAIGHDIRAIASLSTGEEIFVGLAFGLIGTAIAEATAETSRVHFEDEVNQMVYERIQKALTAKGYSVRRLDAVPRTWDLFANLDEGPEVYSRLAEGHTLGPEAERPDAILFFEYLLEGRLEGRLFSSGDVKDLGVGNMRLKYAKSKLFLYNPRTQARLYHDMVQRGYPSFSATTVPEALDTLMAFEGMPAAP